MSISAACHYHGQVPQAHWEQLKQQDAADSAQAWLISEEAAAAQQYHSTLQEGAERVKRAGCLLSIIRLYCLLVLAV
jgi:hypothetical protein